MFFIEEETKLNICYVITTTNKCGPVNVLYNLVSNLDLKEIKPVILTLKKDDEKKSRRAEFEGLGVKVIQFDPKKQIDKIYDFIEENQIDIVHSHGIVPDLVNKKISRKFKSVKCMTTLHNYPVEDYLMTHGKIKGSLMVALQLLAISNLYKVACSKAIQEKFQKNLHIDTYAIENGVNYPLENEIEDGNNIPPVFLYLGEINPRKNVKFLVDVFSKHPEYKLWIVGGGKGSYYEDVKSRVKNINNIVMWGRTNTPDEFYKKADYLISASCSEGLPMMVLEALSYGLPVVLSDIPSHRETLVNSSCGSLYKLNDEQDLENTLIDVVESSFDRKMIYKSSKARFSSKVMANNYVKFYKKLMDGVL